MSKAAAIGVILVGFCLIHGAYAGYSDSEIRAVETSNEGQIREIRQQEIAQYRATLGRHFPENRRADLYYRLAEIYMEAYHMDYILEGRVHDKRIENGKNEASIDHSHSRPHLLNGIKACKELITLGISFSKMDRVYYFLGFNYGELGDRAESSKYFGLLTQHYPNSSFVAEAYRELGDGAFLSGEFRRAIQYFEKGIRGAGANILRMRYRMAWCYYRIREFERAIEVMKLAIDESQKSGEKFLSIREEALRDMALFMTETGRVQEAIQYFQKVASDDQYYPKILEKLGNQFERNVEPAKAKQVYESLLKTHPQVDVTFKVLVRLIELEIKQGQYSQVLTRLNTIQIPDAPEGDVAIALQDLKALVRRTATENHEVFRKKDDRKALEVAESFYYSYLNQFLSKSDPRKEVPEVQMYLADTKREQGKAAQASELYRKVVESRDQRYAKQAGRLWTTSLSEAIKKSGSSQKEPSQLEKELIYASDLLVENLVAEKVGDVAEARDVSLRSAQILAGYNSTRTDAFERIAQIIRKWPKSSQAVTAARLRIQLLSQNGFEQSQLSELRDAIAEYRLNTALLAADRESGKGELEALLTEQERKLKISAITQSEKLKDFAAAARGYEEFSNDHLQGDFLEKALSNALSNYAKVGDLESVNRVAAGWLKRFPKSSKALESFRVTATQMLIGGQFDGSARLFERVALASNDAESLDTAARIHEANGALTLAQKDWVLYLEQFKNSPQRMQIVLTLGKLYESSGFDGESAKMYRLCMANSSELSAECGARLGDLYLRAKDIENAKKTYLLVDQQLSRHQKSRKSGKGHSVASPFLGYVRFKLALQMESEAKSEPLALPEARLKKVVANRINILGTLSKAYFSVVDAGGPWAVAALNQLAQWASHFADEVDQIEAPSEASPESVANFKKALASVSAPVRRTAVDSWRKSYLQSVEAELYSPVVPELLDRLANLKLNRMGRAQGVWGKARLAGISTDGKGSTQVDEGGTPAIQKIRDKLRENPKDAVAWVDYGNLLWGEGKPKMARIAYKRARVLAPKNPMVLNNLAVNLMSEILGAGPIEEVLIATEAASLFHEALENDGFFLNAKLNLASLQNYYRLFKKSKGLWEQVLVKMQSLDAQEGLAIALQGLGDLKGAEQAFAKTTTTGGHPVHFAYAYHEAARLSLGGVEGASQCVSRLSEIDPSDLIGFEKDSVERLKRACELWQN